VVSAGATYLDEALRLVKGIDLEIPYYDSRGPCYYTRGPGFSLILAGAFKLFGTSVETAHNVVRFFYALNIIIVFLLACALFGPVVGFTSSLFVASSYAITSASIPLNLDPVVPVCILLSMLFFVKQAKGKKVAYNILSGISLGVGYLVKETAYLYLLFPMVIFLFKKDFGWKYILKSIFVFYVSFFAVVSPWMLCLASRGCDILRLLLYGMSTSAADIALGESNTFAFMLKGIFDGVLSYYENYLRPNFTLAPLFVVAWVYVIFMAIFKRSRDTVVVMICGLLFLPVLIYVGTKGERIGQAITFFDLSYIALSYFMSSTLHYITQNWIGPKLHVKGRSLYIILSILCFCFGISYGFFKDGTFDLMRGKSHRKFRNTFYAGLQLEIGGRHSEFVKDGCQWITENVPKGEMVYVDGYHWEAFDFFTNMNYKKSHFQKYGERFRLSTKSQTDIDFECDGVVAIWPSLRFRSIYDRYRYIEVMFNGGIMEIIRAAKDHALMISKRNNFIAYYLETLGGNVQYENEEIKIFKGIKNTSGNENGLKLLVSDRFYTILPWLQNSYPKEYSRLEEFLNECGLDIKQLVENTYYEHQVKWVKENIERDAKIGFFWHTGKFLVEEDKRAEYIGRGKHTVSGLAKKYDYLFIHNIQREYNTFPELFKELDRLKPFKKFPTMPYFGENGWEIYKFG